MRLLLLMILLCYASLAADIITLGTVQDLSGSGAWVLRGMQAAINHYNDVPTSHHSARLLWKDDQGDTQKSVKLLEELVEHTKLLCQLQDPALLETTISTRIAQDIVVWGTSPEAMQARAQEDQATIFHGYSLETELGVLLDHAIKKLGHRTFAIVHDTSTWGNRAKNITQQLLAQHAQTIAGVELVGTSWYHADTVQVSAAVKELASVRPQVVLCLGSPRGIYHLIQVALRSGVHHATFIGPSRLAPLQAHMYKSRGIEMMVTSSVPNPKRGAQAFLKEYRADMKQYFGPEQGRPHVLSLQGYISMRLLLSVLNSFKSPPNVTALGEQVRKLENYDLSGLNVRYNMQNKSLQWGLWLGARAKKWQQVRS